jgi:acetate kinase
VKGVDQADNFSRPVAAPDHTVAVGALMDWIEQRIGRDALTAVGHRVVHGGPKYHDPALITKEMVEELRQLKPFDPEHLPEEIQWFIRLKRTWGLKKCGHAYPIRGCANDP